MYAVCMKVLCTGTTRTYCTCTYVISVHQNLIKKKVPVPGWFKVHVPLRFSTYPDTPTHDTRCSTGIIHLYVVDLFSEQLCCKPSTN